VELGSLDLTTADFKRAAGRTAPLAAPRFRPIIGASPIGYRPDLTAAAVGVAPAFQTTVKPVRQSPGPLQTSRYQSGATITPREGDPAKALLDRAIAAKGGLDTLRAIRRLTAKTRTSMTTPDGRTQVADSITYLEYPNHVRVETKLPEASTVQVYDGEHAWVRDPRGVQDVPPRFIKDLQTSLKRDTIAVLVAAAQGTVRSRLLPDVKDDTGRVHHALELSSNDLDPMVLLIDPDTGLIAKQTYLVGGPGQPVIEEAFSDYRPVDGVQIAYAATVRVGGKPTLERHVTDISINPRSDPALFQRPAS
jgi:hypothetical protein